jgi:hypothetical protein
MMTGATPFCDPAPGPVSHLPVRGLQYSADLTDLGSRAPCTATGPRSRARKDDAQVSGGKSEIAIRGFCVGDEIMSGIRVASSNREGKANIARSQGPRTRRFEPRAAMARGCGVPIGERRKFSPAVNRPERSLPNIANTRSKEHRRSSFARNILGCRSNGRLHTRRREQRRDCFLESVAEEIQRPQPA